jgi:hypothetical protein
VCRTISGDFLVKKRMFAAMLSQIRQGTVTYLRHLFDPLWRQPLPESRLVITKQKRVIRKFATVRDFFMRAGGFCL